MKTAIVFLPRPAAWCAALLFAPFALAQINVGVGGQASGILPAVAASKALFNAPFFEIDATAVAVGAEAEYVAGSGGAQLTIDIPGETGVALTADTQDAGRQMTNSDNPKLKPGKDYTVTVSEQTNISEVTLQLDAPPGYRAFIDDLPRSRMTVATGTTFKVRVEMESVTPAGEASSLRPGRIVLTLGLGALSNGRPAGVLSFRNATWHNNAMIPGAVLYDHYSPEVERIFVSGVLRQVYVASCLADITADSSTVTRIKFYTRASGQIGSKSNGLYTLTGDPLYEYVIENSAGSGGSWSVRATKTVRQGGATHDTWTELNSGNMHKDWIEKPANATSVTNTIVRSSTFSNNGLTETIVVANDFGYGLVNTASEEVRTYTDYNWGKELTGVTTGAGSSAEVKNMVYTDKRVTETSGAGVGTSYTAFYTDFDRKGQMQKTSKPFTTTAASASDATVGEVTTYDYAADWTGRKVLPSLIETKINNVLTAKSEIVYTTETVTDSPANVTLVVATRKDYHNSGGTNYLTTVTKTYRDDNPAAVDFLRGMHHSTKRPDGTMSITVLAKGTFDTSSRSFTTAASYNGTDTAIMTMQGTSSTTDSVALGTGPLGSTTAPSGGDASPVDSAFRIVPGISTAEVVIRAADGRVLCTQKWICTGTTSSHTWQLVQRDLNTYDAAFYLASTSRDSGSTSNTWNVVTNSWTKGRLDYTIDESGVRTDFTYDSWGRVATRTRTGASGLSTSITATTTTYTYDAANRVTNETVSASGTSETLVTVRVFDTAGRLTSESKPGQAATTVSFALSTSGRTTTTTPPATGTKIDEKFLDGRLKSVTGTGVVHESYAYATETDGRLKTTVTIGSGTARTRTTWTDMLGRAKKTSRPGFTGQVASEENNNFDATSGLLLYVNRTGYGDSWTLYNSMSQPYRTGLEVEGNGFALASNDRITDTTTTFESVDSVWWATKVTTGYPTANSATAKEMGRTRTRLTGLTSSLRGETRTIDAEGNETRVTTTVDAANKIVTVTTKRPGMLNDAVEKSLNGFVVEATGHDGLTFKKRYDALSRPNKDIDPRTGTGTYATVTTTYITNSPLPYETRDATNRTLAKFAYDNAGRTTYTEDALGKTTRTAYTLRGEVEKVWGSATYPVQYGYDDWGAKTTMRTYRDPTGAAAADSTTFPTTIGTGDLTTWEYDAPSGLLKKKIDAKSAFVEYTYNLRGQTYQRFWSRTLPSSSTRVTATYAYDSATGENTGITYNDGTPAVTYTYTRSSQVDTVADTTGTRDFIYDSTKPWRLAGEALDAFYGSRLLTPTYETTLSTNTGDTSYTGHTLGSVPGRVKGLQLGTTTTPAADLEFIYATSNAGRIAGLVSKRGNGAASRQFVYGYETNSALVKSLSVVSNAFFVTRDFEANRDLMTKVETKWSTATRTRYDYAYDDRRLRQSVVQSGDVFADYGGPDGGAIHQIFAYNARGEVTTAATYLGATATDQTTPLSARRHEWDYDGIGNRKWSNTSGNTALKDNYTVNELNQYTARENNTLAVGGVADTDALVAARSTALAGRAGKHWGDNITVENAFAPFSGNVKFYAVKPGAGSNAYSRQVIERLAFLPPAAQAMTYDTDGNLTNDGVWIYTWDAENRLTAMETTAGALQGGMTAQKLEFKYDYMGRRVEKLVRGGWNGSAFTTVTLQRRYLYDGWSLIAEFAVSGSTLTTVRTYTWGLDIARSLKDAGGVGALIQMRDYSGGKDYFPSYDGNGNIAALFDADSSSGTVVAAYEYSPYGEFLRCEGSYAKENPFRFSTKFTDDETGLVYYGKRYYSPREGRFLCRDPKEEFGGANVMAFVTNNPINKWDYLGMWGSYSSGGDGYWSGFSQSFWDLVAISESQVSAAQNSSTNSTGVKKYEYGTSDTKKDIVLSDDDIAGAFELLRQTVPSGFFDNFIGKMTIRTFTQLVDLGGDNKLEPYYTDVTAFASSDKLNVYVNLNRTAAFSEFSGTKSQFLAGVILHEAFHLGYNADGFSSRPGVSEALVEAVTRYYVEEWAINNNIPTITPGSRAGGLFSPTRPDFNSIYNDVAQIKTSDGKARYSTIPNPSPVNSGAGPQPGPNSNLPPVPPPPVISGPLPPPRPASFGVSFVGGSTFVNGQIVLPLPKP